MCSIRATRLRHGRPIYSGALPDISKTMSINEYPKEYEHYAMLLLLLLFSSQIAFRNSSSLSPGTRRSRDLASLVSRCVLVLCRGLELTASITQQHQALIELQKSSRSLLDRRTPFTTLHNAGSSSRSHQQAMTGYLLKRGNSIRTWKKRFFVSDPEAKILRYFTNEEVSDRPTLSYRPCWHTRMLIDPTFIWSPRNPEVMATRSDSSIWRVV